MRNRAWVPCLLGATLLSVGLASGCVSKVEVVGQQGDGGSGGEGGSQASTTRSTSNTSSTSSAHLPDYEDPGCPDAPPPTKSFQCDPYQQNNGDCSDGMGCYIYVDYPTEPCGQEVYGAACAFGGFGQQGDECMSAGDCGGGLACVVTGSGNQCVTLCSLEGDSGCPSGLVCEPIDVEGFGGCL